MKQSVLLSALLLVSVFSGHYALTEAQVDPPPASPVPLISTLKFNYSGLDSTGQPETIKEAELAITREGEALPGAVVIKTARIPMVAGENSFALAGFWGDVPPGRYWVWLRGWDEAGNYGPWSSWLITPLDKFGPEAQTGLRYILEIIAQ